MHAYIGAFFIKLERPHVIGFAYQDLSIKEGQGPDEKRSREYNLLSDSKKYSYKK